MGRIGVKIAPSNPEVVYVIAESNEGVLFRSDDRGRTFHQVSDNVSIVSRGLYYADMRVDPTNENHVFAISSRLFRKLAKTVKIELPEGLEEVWKSHDEKLEEILGHLTRPEGKTYWSQGPRHDERVTGLMFELGYAFAAPTAAQMDYLAELRTEHEEVINAWRSHLAETLPTLSEGLVAAGLPGLLLPAEIGDL